jgi:hypothetical protein
VTVDTNKEHRIIEVGPCGTVFEIRGTELVIKKEVIGRQCEMIFFSLIEFIMSSLIFVRVLHNAFSDRTLSKTFSCSQFSLSEFKDEKI